jgi:hypothetical protein
METQLAARGLGEPLWRRTGRSRASGPRASEPACHGGLIAPAPGAGHAGDGQCVTGPEDRLVDGRPPLQHRQLRTLCNEGFSIVPCTPAITFCSEGA